MRLVLAHDTFSSLGGATTYLLTVAEHLQRLGHDVVVHARDTGEAAELAEDRGVRVVADPDRLPAERDGVLVQDGAVAYALAERYPDTPRVFVVHSIEAPHALPPQLPDVCQAAVAMSDRVHARVEALAVRPEIVRLRQPVDLWRFGGMGIPRREAQRAIVLSNFLSATRGMMLAHACKELGWEFDLVGRHGTATPEPERAIAAADLVIGQGRSVLEAMAGGRAAYVYGMGGGDGWVTPSTYAGLESDGFTGMMSGATTDYDRVRAELAGWDRRMGERNRELARRNHDAADHAAALVELFERHAGSARRPPGASDELARLVRLQWQTESRARQAELEARQTAYRVQRAEAERDAAWERLEELRRSRRWRIARALSRPLDAARRRRTR